MLNIPSAAKVFEIAEAKREKDYHEYLNRLGEHVYAAAERGCRSIAFRIETPKSWVELTDAQYATLCAKAFTAAGYFTRLVTDNENYYHLLLNW